MLGSTCGRCAFFPIFFDACIAVYNARRFWSFLANMPFWSFWLAISEPGLPIKKVPLAVLLKLAWRSHTRRWSSQIGHCAEIKFEWRGCFWRGALHPPPCTRGQGASAPTAGQGFWVLVFGVACQGTAWAGVFFNS